MTKRSDWQAQGEDPDYRFTFANERTFLAWIRTALALLAGGLFINQLGASYPRELVMFLAVTLTAMSAVLSAVAYARWKANEIAMRHKSSLPHNSVVLWACLATAAIAALASILIVQ